MRTTSFYFGQDKTFVRDSSGVLAISEHLASSIRLAGASGMSIDKAQRISKRFRGLANGNR